MSKGSSSTPSGILITIVIVFWAAVAAVIITTPLSLTNQVLFGLSCGILLFIVARRKNHWTHIVMLLMCVIVSTRYLYWRTTETLVFDSFLEGFLGIGLLLAEFYAWLILTLGFFQTIWPLDRRIEPMPDDVNQWPTVDIYIPTYNESIEVVKDTVLAAQNIDYPPEKVRVYILDDGRRAEFGAFAAAAGVGYISRDDNKHAKAGNLNNAIRTTNGELICIFDCDHVSTRAFLQATVGSFIKDKKLALMQTPHFFYSPDPFERNLTTGDEIPREGELFYGPVQKGNDFWNAAFFCGSCAVIRRSAIEEIGGFAVETVTEDAHTALKLQRLGWNSAFLALPLAAGLATERLALHIGQRARWARGMTQILRMDNPLLGKGLTFAQRLCYLNAMMHFLFALPRIVFLTAPLCYLLFGQNIIDSSPEMILAYALPHLLFTTYTNSRLQGRFRHTFWGEIYEAVLSFHLVLPTLATIINPRKGKFNVTEKGGLLENGYFDYDMVKPHLFTLVLLLCGFFSGVVQLIWSEHYNVEPKVLLLNLFWAGFSCVMLFASVAVAREMKQIRQTVRLDISLPVVLHLDSGHTLRTKSINLSMGGALVENVTQRYEEEHIKDIEIYLNSTPMAFPVETVFRDDETIRFKFEELPIPQRRELVKVVMGRADAWLPGSAEPKENNVLVSIWRVIRSIAGLFRESAQKKKERDYELQNANKPLSGWKPRLALLVLIAISAVIISNQALSAPMQSQSAAATSPKPAKPALVNPALTGPAPNVRTEDFTFEEFGMQQDLYFFGNNTSAGLTFTLRSDEFVRLARLKLKLSYSDALLEDESFLDVILNGQLLKSIELTPFNAKALEVELPIEPAMILGANNLDFRLTGRTLQQCNNELSKDIWIRIDQSSEIVLSMQRLAVTTDLSRFPEPFFNPGAMNRVTLPIVVPSKATPVTLTSGAIVASYIGSVAEYRSLSFPVVRNRLPPENAIVFVMPNETISGLSVPPIKGPELRLIENPVNPVYKLLLVMGRTPEELKVAATHLVMRTASLNGTYIKAEATQKLSREPYDAPRWTAIQRPVAFGELVDESRLVSKGLFHRPLELSFRASPDLFFWDREVIPLTVKYNFPEGQWLNEEKSSLDVSLNGRYLTSLPVNQTGLWASFTRKLGRDIRQEEAQIEIPPYLLYGENTLQLYHNFVVKGDDCELNVPAEIAARVLPNSSLDLSSAKNFTVLPNLSFFVGVGFPFTRYADLGQTVVLLPEQPGNEEIETLFELAARMGNDTGFPALEMEVKTSLAMTKNLADHDILAIANLKDLRESGLLDSSPFAIHRDRLTLKPFNWFDRVLWFVQGDWDREAKSAARVLDSTQKLQGLFSFVSPVDSDRIVVLVTAESSAQLPVLVDSLNKPLVSSKVQGDMALVDATGQVRSNRVGEQIASGDMPWHMEVRWFFGQHVIFMVIGLALAAFTGAAILFPLLKHRAETRLKTGADDNE
ncbi:UDP-forming cellulose synthase catalytic subunit [Rheinheimera sediminis]|uniref:UDP-forming cellulose synthase catalytic subunit n=1 Tax=Rheinheimera sp. YQF-1 TaxID=2499626 RepID=UPI000FDB133F|nr:UDP-forming cellulose synthase catalytic subunit [Rheinheimera sp. YQF-1]RVT47138.1 UDP-forming cellulose synthase catalytic subunit [Rheinheimera sp. YQF-1]